MKDPEIERVRKAAALARLEITDDEVRTLGPQFARILEHFRALAALDVEGVEPTTGATSLTDVLRPDVPRPSPGTERMLAGAPEGEDGFFRVPKTIRED